MVNREEYERIVALYADVVYRVALSYAKSKEDAYDVMNIEQGHYFDGFVSRKKQMLPPLIDLEDRRS